jgi:hypothetical protein
VPSNGHSLNKKLQFPRVWIFISTDLIFPTEGKMKQSDFLENAENCALMAELATDEPTRNRYKRMEAGWRALAEEQDWLEGKIHPLQINIDAPKRRP